MTATADIRQTAQYMGLALCTLIMRTALWVFGILWGYMRASVITYQFGRIASTVRLGLLPVVSMCQLIPLTGG